MKMAILAVLAVAIAMPALALKKDPAYREARANGARARLILNFADDDGLAVSNVDVNVFMGMNFRPKGYYLKGQSDSNGVYVVEGKTCGDEIVISAKRQGYYDTSKRMSFATMGAERDVKKGKWQPWGESVPVLMRKISSPTEMIRARLREFRGTTRLHEWLGYDLANRDFVQPVGCGDEADFELYFDWDGNWLPNYNGMAVKIRFTAPHSGFYAVDAKKASAFIWPYSANVAGGYVQSAEFYEKVLPGGQRERHEFDKSKCWVVRSRCKVDKDNRLLSANYSVIENIEISCDPGSEAGVCIRGVFNPTPNDTNLEPK